MFKKSVSLLLILILSISTFSMVTHAENNLEYVNKSFYSYAEPSFNSAKQNSGVQYGPQDVRIIEKRDNGWWKIGTWEGDSWINVNGESRILADLYAYEEPSFSSQKANGGQKYGRQTFIIIDGTTDGWLKIQTWEGDKWINPKTQQQTEYVGKDVFSYDEPSFNSQKANSGHPYGPQNWNVIEKRSNGWWKVATYEGEKWLAPNGELRLIEKPSFVYNEPSFNALKGNGGYKYDAQNFNIIDGTKNGWLKVQTWEGDKWMIPNGELRFVNKSLYVYNEPSFSAVKGNGGYKYDAQNFNIIDGTTDGWLKVQTWEGDKWLNMNEENESVEFYVESTAYSVEKSSPSERITAAGIDIGKNPNIKLIAVDPKVIPLRTKVYVDGYGEAIAGDTGGAIKGKKIDVLFPTDKEARQWGRKTVKIRILK
ncbi:fibronectin [Bacillus cereus]|uniref:3D domain-containing protein n=1 Tax=Bacillus TaxID=1386 RepID=UPI0007B6C6BC|nr:MULTISPECIES: 3D domain-containing protein [Bacillus]ANC20806.1 fibronectin [Bacillus cereus]MDA2474901.1 3D domain-containing protein [Bacillus cereus]MDA2492491.1 3D domain-containing protein [Bacillus cereus]